MNSSYIVSATWLAEHLQDPLVVVIDCRFSLMDIALGRIQYQTSHIAGAYYLDLNLDLSSPVQKHGGRHPLPDIAELAAKLSQMGVTAKTLVVAYDDSRFGFAARLWWLLRYMGHESIALLDGGFAGWQALNYPIASELPPPKSGNFIPKLQTEWIVDIETVKARKDLPEVALVDSREADRYRGEREPIDPIAGHIAGAVNYPWMEVTNEQGFVVENYRDRWQELQQAQEIQEIIVYCGSGVTACVNLLSLSLAGITNAKLYAGSWSDWCSYLSLDLINTANINFRLAQFIDIDPLIELAQEFYKFEQITFDEGVLKAFTALLSDDQLGLIWLICDRDVPIGYVALTFFFSMEYHGRCGLVDELYIQETHRGQGIGKKVFTLIEEYLRSKKMRSLSLVVDHWNDKAEIFYTKLGFQREKRHLMVKHFSQH